MKPGRDWPSGPPWMSTSTGRLPAKLAGGRVMKPWIARASKLVHWIGVAAANERASRPGAVVSVQRVTALLSRSIDHTSLGLCAELRLKATSREVSRQTAFETVPDGSAGDGRLASVVAS